MEHALAFERHTASSFNRSFGNDVLEMTDEELQSGGVAAADVDGDGDVDFYVVGGNTEPNHFYRNRGDGTFEEVGTELGLDLVHWGSGPAFGDIDGDGDLDLFVGAVLGDPHHVFENRLDQAEARFVDATRASGIRLSSANTMSATFFDYDRDGFVDLFLTHWGNRYEAGKDTETVWRNNGDGSFVNTSIESGIAAALVELRTDWSFTPNFSDIDGDGDADLLMSSDFEESQVFLNNDDGTFTNVTDQDVMNDQAGMGAAVGDYDNDGDMDWFVTSIYNLDLLDGNYIGNRLYRNEGGGVFSDITRPARVADGGWAWGACAADFDNDGNVDILHVNGWDVLDGKDYRGDPIRFFHNTGPGIVFREIAREIGLTNDAQGRGVACFDMGRDGDVDVLISNNSGDNVVLYRNETTNDNHYLGVRLEGAGANRLGIGARITATTVDGSQIRDLGGRNNYVSHDPFEVHFGLAEATQADIDVRWPDGTTSTMHNVAADQQITLRQPATNLRLVVLQGDGDGVYDEGDVIPVEAAQATDGYHFSHWSTSGGGTFADPRSINTTFTMPAMTVTITAHYLPGVSPTADASAARRWNEVLLQAIRNDYARPTVHARNLFHVSAAMYDAWAAYDEAGQGAASPWLLGRTRAGSRCAFSGVDAPGDTEDARRTALGHAAYRIIRHRFDASPGTSRILRDAEALMGHFGYDTDHEETDIDLGPAALGNHIGQCYIDFGLLDGANEINDYANVAYEPVNAPLDPSSPGNPDITDLNRWQPLSLEEFVDQAGNPADSEPEFLSPEWGSVVPFALAEEDLAIRRRDGYDYWVYHDPGAPPLIDGEDPGQYKWSHALVAVWSSHLDPADGVTMDISPAGIGNISSYPVGFADHPDFYAIEGGDGSPGHTMNPSTGLRYEPQVVPRGDYTRVLAEFWADGPDSETPPGHWFVILNEVNDHPMLRRRFRGEGPELGLLEWDVKGYFALGGAMHDAAITAWGVKGFYDYIRPISSLRAMADQGQSSDPEGSSYHVDGIPLRAGYIELVEADDSLAGDDGEHVGKVKFLAWRGPEVIDDPEADVAGVGWILAENWWPYQRPTFVTPPFAGYVSGHSTYSRAAAELLTAMTGDAHFPGGMSDFEIEANEFLVFEDGPSVDMTLQWATYRDASDQCSLSRIWGGIHPPADDIPGRLMGIEVGVDAFTLAERHFAGEAD